MVSFSRNFLNVNGACKLISFIKKIPGTTIMSPSLSCSCKTHNENQSNSFIEKLSQRFCELESFPIFRYSFWKYKRESATKTIEQTNIDINSISDAFRNSFSTTSNLLRWFSVLPVCSFGKCAESKATKN